MCGCSQKVSGPVSIPKAINKIVADSTECSVTLDELIVVKNDLISKKTPLNSSFVNRRLGYIETMINKGQYCLYALNSLTL